jgi:hypothetical protein
MYRRSWVAWILKVPHPHPTGISARFRHGSSGIPTQTLHFLEHLALLTPLRLFSDVDRMAAHAPAAPAPSHDEYPAIERAKRLLEHRLYARYVAAARISSTIKE